MKDLLYIHGFATDSNAFKANYLEEKLKDYPEVNFFRPNFNPSSTDFKHKTITGMIARLREFILANELKNPYIIASSLSGIVALNYAKRYQNIAGLLLLAPMLRYIQIHTEQEELDWQRKGEIKVQTSFADDCYLSYNFAIDARNYQKAVSPPPNCKIIHGKFDETIAFAESLKYANEYGLELIALAAKHSLAEPASLERIWRESQILLNLD